MTGISEVAQVVFVRKRMVEVQYLRTTITEEQRQEFGHLVDDTIRRIESAAVPAAQRHSFSAKPLQHLSVRGALSGEARIWSSVALVRRPGAETLGWLDELNY